MMFSYPRSLDVSRTDATMSSSQRWRTDPSARGLLSLAALSGALLLLLVITALHAIAGGWPTPALAAALTAVTLLSVRRHAAQTRGQYRLDPLTGTLNRTGLLEEVDVTQRRGETAGLLLLDIDHFASINDSLGDRSGDEFLTVTVSRIRAAAHADDIVARIAADSFAVLCRGSQDLAEATGCANRIAAAVGEQAPVGGGSVRRSVSIGVALVQCEQVPAAEFLRRGHHMLVQAQTLGDGRVQVYDSAAVAAEHLRRTVGADLPAALSCGDVRVAYQPIVSLRDGSVTHVEALVRWAHPTLGEIPADRLVAIAEETGATDLLGRYVLRCATQAIAGWNASHPGRPPMCVAVNVAPQQLLRGQLLGDVRDALAASGMDGATLVLELTESAVIDTSTDVLILLNRLRRLGIRLAMDDYGTGYSSLANLVRLPLDVLKIDRTFVQRLGAEQEDVLVGAVASIGRVRGLCTVAEGVETAAELSHVIRLQVDLAQGYLFAKPLEYEDLEQITVQEGVWRAAVAGARVAAELPGSSASPATPVTTEREVPAMRVLILDDNSRDVALFTTLLRHAGHEVVGINDPAEFPAAMAEHRPDVVLMDLRLSAGRTGVDLLAELREAGDRHTPVIAVTGYPEWSTRMLLGPTGFAGMIHKPIDVPGFAAEVSAYLHGYDDGSRRRTDGHPDGWASVPALHVAPPAVTR